MFLEFLQLLIGIGFVVAFFAFLVSLPLRFFSFVRRKIVEGIEKQEIVYVKTRIKTELPYVEKRYFFSKSELEFFKILNSNVDAHRYTIFPKVRLADFIEVDHYVHKDWVWFNKIRSKHVDFLIWDLVESEIVLAIELDGRSHETPEAYKRDNFVEDLYQTVGLRLVRVHVGTDFNEESAKIREMLH